MKKTININISRSIFTIDDDAYEVLKSYLDSVKEYFSKYPDNDEIVSDIENRIAEQLSAKKQPLGKTIVTLRDVEELINTMGKVEDFAETNTEEEPLAEEKKSESVKESKRLFRDPDHKLLFGVASGLAAYFDIDPIIVRVLFVIATFVGGWGIIAYLILWLVVPEATTASEKMQMHGGSLTIASIEKKFKEEFKTVSEKEPEIRNSLKKFFDAVAMILNFIFKKLFLVIARIITTIAGIGFSIAILGLVFATTALLVNYHSPYFNVPLRTIISAPAYYFFIFSAFFTLFIPLLLCALGLIQIGIGKIAKMLRKGAVISLAALWIVSVSVSGSLIIRYAPDIRIATENEHQAQLASQITQTYDLKGFTGIDSSGLADISIMQGKVFAVSATSSEDQLANLQFTVENGILKIQKQEKHSFCFLCFSRGRINTAMQITLPELSEITARDAIKITSGSFSVDSLSINASDLAHVELQVKAKRSIDINARDASRIIMTGSTPLLNLKTSDIARTSADTLEANTVSVEAHDASRAIVKAITTLTATASDIARIDYIGNPEVTKNVRDAGQINP